MQENSIYTQLTLDFPNAVETVDSQNIIQLRPAEAVFKSVEKRGREAESRFTAFFSKYLPHADRLLRSFDNMEEAEDQIYAGFGRYPEQAQLIDRVLPALYSTNVLATTGYDLYVAHIKCLIDRVGQGDTDVSVATDAEVIAAIHGISLITPTKKFVGQGYWLLFQRLFPGKARELGDDMDIFAMPKWEYEREQVFDFVEGIRRKLRIQGRKISSLERRTYQYSRTLKRFYFANPQYAPAGFFQSEEALHYLNTLDGDVDVMPSDKALQSFTDSVVKIVMAKKMRRAS